MSSYTTDPIILHPFIHYFLLSFLFIQPLFPLTLLLPLPPLLIKRVHIAKFHFRELGEILADPCSMFNRTVSFGAPRNAPTRDNGHSKLQRIYKAKK